MPDQKPRVHPDSASSSLRCPNCRSVLAPATWRDERRARCSACATEIEFRPFAALRASVGKPVAEAPVHGDEARCFYHAENQAAACCCDCGRLICPVCSIAEPAGVRCPACVGARQKTRADSVHSRFLWGNAALWLVKIPVGLALLTIGVFAVYHARPHPASYVIFGVTGMLALLAAAAGAPAAIVLVLVGWNKPPSLLGRRRWHYVVALLGAAVLFPAALYGLYDIVRDM